MTKSHFALVSKATGFRCCLPFPSLRVQTIRWSPVTHFMTYEPHTLLTRNFLKACIF